MGRKTSKHRRNSSQIRRRGTAESDRITKLLHAASSHQQAGKFAEAVQCYREILEHAPDHADVLHHLGLLQRQLGRADEAIELLRRALAVRPTDSVCQNNLGNMLREQGRVDAAVAAYQNAVRYNPDYINAYYNLGTVLQERGDAESAEGCYRNILRIEPSDVEVWNSLGTALAEQGKSEAAVDAFERALSIRPQQPRTLYNLGSVFKILGRLSDAIGCYQKALSLKPDYAEAHNNLGTVLRAQGDLEQAVVAYREAVRLRPDHIAAQYNLAEAYSDLDNPNAAMAAYRRVVELKSDHTKAHHRLGRVLMESRQYKAAADAFQQAIRWDPGFAEAHCDLGSAYKYEGKLDAAIAEYREALRIDPDYAEAHNNLGLMYMDEGKFAEATTCLRKALELEPDLTEASLNLSRSRSFTVADRDDIERFESILRRPSLSDDAKVNLHFALGKVYDDCKIFDKAFSHYQTANRLKRKSLSFNTAHHVASITKSIRIFSRELFESCRGLGATSELPVFIVGMPRSGTSLVEQILSAHPRIHGAGELTHIREITARLSQHADNTTPYPECIALLDPTTAQFFAGEYLSRLPDAAGAAVRVTDKMPTNFLHLGLIAVLFPKARIIHCRRDPLDVCLSNYFQLFGQGHNWAYDLSELSAYYREYERLMRHWKDVLPVDVFDVRYEELVENQEAVSRQLIDYCGLDWDETCLDFHTNNRPVQTASNWQVRQPIYKSASKRWKNYEEHLDELKRGLARQCPLSNGVEPLSSRP